MRYLSCCTAIEQNCALLWSYPTIHDRYWNTTRIAYTLFALSICVMVALHYIRHLLPIYTWCNGFVSKSFIHSWFHNDSQCIDNKSSVGLYIIYYDFILPVVDLYYSLAFFFSVLLLDMLLLFTSLELELFSFCLWIMLYSSIPLSFSVKCYWKLTALLKHCALANFTGCWTQWHFYGIFN